MRKPGRLLPPLMYLFRDAHRAGDARKHIESRDADGTRIVSGRRGLSRQPVSEAVLQQEVSSNISNLLNTVHMEATEDFARLDEVRTSIVNYGMPDLSRLSIDDSGVDDIASDIRHALVTYEPRLARGSVEAVRDNTASKAGLEVRFFVRADLMCQPVNVPVEFVAEVERDTAKFRVEGL